MIISRTPLRVSFVGGGSDIRSYYQFNGGAVLSTSIDKYVFVIVNKHFEGGVRASYSETENVSVVSELKHNYFREALKEEGIDKGVELATMADIPGKGTGLGSSSSLSVGLYNALDAFLGKKQRPKQELAEAACDLEIKKLSQPIGKQDQYAAAFGGLNVMRFNPDDRVEVTPVKISKKDKQEMQDNLLLFYTGVVRAASSILSGQSKAMASEEEKRQTMGKMVAQVDELRDHLKAGELNKLGEFLHQGWELKKKMAGGISNPQIDAWYGAARKAGALGGKILGAGGGGFLLFYSEKKNHDAVKKALSELRYTPFKFEEEGTKIVFKG